MYKTGDHQGLVDDVVGILGLVTIGVAPDACVLIEIIYGRQMLSCRSQIHEWMYVVVSKSCVEEEYLFAKRSSCL